MAKKNEQAQVRHIAPGITLTGWKSVENWDSELRRAVRRTAEAKVKTEKGKQEDYDKDVEFTPDFETL